GRYADPKTFDAVPQYGLYATLAKDLAALGHTLVVPVDCVPKVDLIIGEPERRLNIVNRATKLWLEAAFGVPRVHTAVAGEEVPHAHVHHLPPDPNDPRRHWRILGAPDPKPFLTVSPDQRAELNQRATFDPEYAAMVLGQLAGGEIHVPTMVEMAHDLRVPLPLSPPTILA